MQNDEKGGVALEYILVSTFAAIATTIVLGVLTSIAKKKIQGLADKYHVESDMSDFNLLKD